MVKAELHQAPTHGKPAKRSRTIHTLKSRYVTQADLGGARHAEEVPLPTTVKRKSKNLAKEAPSKRAAQHGGTILADDSEVER